MTAWKEITIFIKILSYFLELSEKVWGMGRL